MKDRETLFTKLQRHHADDIYPLHMPGHKRNLPSPGNPYTLDITEIGGFDNLHHATGILKEMSRRAAALYHAEKSYLLVGGSTAGLLCAVSAACREKKTILLARNCHRAAYNAAYINRLQVRYVYPKWIGAYGFFGGISPADVESALANDPSIGAVVITSPTYEGIVSDVAAIADCCHRHGAALIVDEAHGAHFGFSEKMPPSAVTCGADAVVMSLHKTMPALTQTALLHANGTRIDRALLRRYFSIYQTSSPSYLLLGSIDDCLTRMETDGAQLFADYEKRLEKLRDALRGNVRLSLAKLSAEQKKEAAVYAVDPGRIVLSLAQAKLENFGGGDLLRVFRETYKLELEMAGTSHAVAIVTMMDTDAGLARFASAAHEIDAMLGAGECGAAAHEIDAMLGAGERGAAAREINAMRGAGEYEQADSAARESAAAQEQAALCRPDICMPLAQAYDGKTEECPLFAAAGKISAEFVCLYPPGIPLLAPGERVQDAQLAVLARAQAQGIAIEGLTDEPREKLRIVIEV